MKVRSALALITSVGLMAVSCEGSTPPLTNAEPRVTGAPPEVARCSASGLSTSRTVEPRLPKAVAATRSAIAEGAIACDFEGLAQLALADGNFVWSFGSDASPSVADLAAEWRRAEQQGDDIMATLVQLLDLRHARRGRDFVWPSAFGTAPNETDWAQLEAVYDAEEIAAFSEFGAYIGWRTGIGKDGDWNFFVQGE